MNVNKIREDFPILQKKFNNKPIIYFDNACMTLKPKQVVAKVDEYYNEYPACAERSHHKLGQRATEEYEKVRGIVKKFINAQNESEIIFTRNSTEGINLISKSFKFNKDHVIVHSDKEHNSNLIPWHILTKEKNVRQEIIDTKDGFDIVQFEKTLGKIRMQGKNPFVSIFYTSNLDGSVNPIKEIIKIAHEHDAKVLVDAAQSVPHRPIDVKRLDADFLVFSGHKMLGPTGTGVLYGKSELLEKLNPYNVGGSTVTDSTYDSFAIEEIPARFEAGLQDYAGIIGLGAACEYLSKHIDDIESHEFKLNKIMSEGLKNKISIIGPQDPKLRSGILSFNANNKMDYHEIAIMLDSFANIMIRSGRHCVHSWFNANNIDGSARASTYLYNTEEEAKVFVEKLGDVLKMKK